MLRETLSVISTSLVEIWCITINHCLSFPTIWQHYSELIRLILAAAYYCRSKYSSCLSINRKYK